MSRGSRGRPSKVFMAREQDKDVLSVQLPRLCHGNSEMRDMEQNQVQVDVVCIDLRTQRRDSFCWWDEFRIVFFSVTTRKSEKKYKQNTNVMNSSTLLLADEDGSHAHTRTNAHTRHEHLATCLLGDVQTSSHLPGTSAS